MPTPTSNWACPTPTPQALRAVPRIAAQAVLATRYPLAGAVQVNAHFRKPLEPQPSTGREPWRARLEALAGAGAPRLVAPQAVPHPQAVAQLVAQVRAAPRGVLVAGPMPLFQAADLRRAVQRFLVASGYVLLAEATSQLRFGLDASAQAACCGAFDALLRERALRQRLRPELALEIGAPAVSAQWLAWIDGDDAPARLVLPGGRPADPAGGAQAMLLGPVADLLDAAAAQLQAQPRGDDERRAGTSYRQLWQTAEAAAWAARGQGDCRTLRSRRPTARHCRSTTSLRCCARPCPPAPRWPSAIPARCATSTTTCHPTPGCWACCTSAALPASTAWSQARPAHAV